MSAKGPAIKNAKVTLDNSLNTETNSKGEFVFHNVKSGSHKFAVSAGKIFLVVNSKM